MIPEEMSQLKNLYQNPNATTTEREHAFFRYWIQYIHSLSENISEHDLQQIKNFDTWVHAVSSIVVTLCELDKLSAEQAYWILETVSLRPFAKHQLQAFLVLHGNDSRIKQLQQILALNAIWAAKKIIEGLPYDLLHEARELIVLAKYPKSTKRNLHDLIERQERKYQDSTKQQVL